MKKNRNNDDWGFGLSCQSQFDEYPCFECGQKTKNKHHVVPVSRGGTKRLPLCDKCHSKAHGEAGNAYKSELIREGLNKAKSNGKKLGPPIKIDLLQHEKIRTLRNNGMTIKEISGQTGFSIGAIHKAINKATTWT